VKLLIAIPALNEEESIEAIIEQSLAARSEIIAASPVTEVDVTVVSDGSTDRTVALASQHLDRIHLVVFDENRGYGAAIKEAWRQSDAELLGFIDADGTCDPRVFADLCRLLEAEGADVVLGSRLHGRSEMPVVRRLGNVVFAVLLTAFSSNRVRDTASGMRVVRRSCLPELLPLPDGLHFTPAMTARALLGEDIVLREMEMPYGHREGRSKLRVGRDGLRFLRVILETAWLYRPNRLLAGLGVLALVAAAVLMIEPSLYYLDHRRLQEWMIYRFVVGSLLGLAGWVLICAGHVTQRIVEITLLPAVSHRAEGGPLGRVLFARWFWAVPVVLCAAGGALVVPSALELVRTGATYAHWSRFIAMSFLVSVAIVVAATRIIDLFLDRVAERLAFLKDTAGDPLRSGVPVAPP
jgi:glycosyltransferase involved in cell wall biosynthesis